MHARTSLSRRALLGLVAAMPLAACTEQQGPPPPPDPDDLLRAAAVEREQGLLRAYDDALLLLPALAPRLVPLRTEHAEHLAALTGEAAATGSPVPSPSGPPLSAQVALRGLVQAERTAGAAHGQAALQASRDLAGLLASLSASELSHPVVLA
jgi:hypothetical protein